MTKKHPQLDKPVHWQPFRLDDVTYDLSHLDSHVVELVHTAQGDKAAITYRFHVTYSFHCFAKAYPEQSEEDRKRLEYVTHKEARPFCFKRYELSKNLPEIVENLDSAKLIFHAGYESFAVCEVKNLDGDDVDYFVNFVAYREKKKLRLHIKSAYPLDEKLGKVKKVNIFAIARAVLQNKPLPKPQK